MMLPNAVLFPHSLLPLHIFEPRYRQMLSYCLKGERMFSVALTKIGVREPASVDDLRAVAGIGLIRACVGNENGTSNLVLQGLARIRIVEWTQEEPFRIAEIELLESRLGNTIEAEALGEKVKELCVRMQQLGLQLPQNLLEQMHQIDNPEILADVVGAAFINEVASRQRLLETEDVAERLRLLIQLLRAQGATE
ncbi:MAG: LON peptidase substrate-binding domain-containing protein [Verrucomicrobia bacterium]|nr:LON peptidase substrate-binding domain-containing protein [Verrucomicrobiota bacterium]